MKISSNEVISGLIDGDKVMALSKVVRDALEAEQASVADNMAQTAATLQHLQKRHDALSSILGEETAPDVAGMNGFRQLGFRDALRAVLREAGELKPAKVTRIMRARGYQMKGKTDLGVRVGNELWKMCKTGTMSKNSAGEYFVPGS